MLKEIKNRIDKELTNFISYIGASFSLRKISPLLYANIKDFILRKGKRIRPTLFVVGYLGFSKKPKDGLYRSAIALELLHDFMLIHDDIIDKSDSRRGSPSMHVMLANSLLGRGRIKFNGCDLAIVAGDVIYTMAVYAFLAIKEGVPRKEQALKKFIEAAIYTGSGEFMELVYGTENLENMKIETIYRIYDYKTAFYSFAYPLACGAILAGAHTKEIDRLFKYGIAMGRAFQIKDDILGMFSEETEIGKSTLTDLKEAKKTILIWYAYNYAPRVDKLKMRQILSKERVNRTDLLIMRSIIKQSGALDYAKKQVHRLMIKAQECIPSLAMKERYKTFLFNYPLELLRL